MGKRLLLEMKEITKEFPGVKALNSVNIGVEKGEVHALMGENGAGKSTLIKILTGAYQKDSGQIIFDGSEVSFSSPLHSQLGGISTIYQEINLVPYLSVTENIFMGREPKTKWGTIDWRLAHREAAEVLAKMGICVDVKKSVGSLSAAEQQMVSISRAVSLQAKLVVMDEPTSSLDDQEVKVLFDVIRSLKADGVSIIYISHRMSEIYTVCDRITVLRDGSYVGTWPTEGLTEVQLIAHMIGKKESDVLKLYEAKKTTFSDTRDEVIRVNGLKRGNKVRDISFSIMEGEVLGLAGLLGSGRTEVAKLIFGVDHPDSGTITFNNEEVKFKSPRDAIRRGIGFCSENRKTEGINPNMSVKENISIASLRQLATLGFVSRNKQDEIVDNFIKKLGVKTPHAMQKIRNLSGGNQQKAILGRWLALNPKLLILDEPTRGIDVGAKAEIHSLIAELSAKGVSILMISSEFEELIQNTDRIVVLREGESIGEVTGEDKDKDVIMNIIARNKPENGQGEECHAS